MYSCSFGKFVQFWEECADVRFLSNPWCFSYAGPRSISRQISRLKSEPELKKAANYRAPHGGIFASGVTANMERELC